MFKTYQKEKLTLKMTTEVIFNFEEIKRNKNSGKDG